MVKKVLFCHCRNNFIMTILIMANTLATVHSTLCVENRHVTGIHLFRVNQKVENTQKRCLMQYTNNDYFSCEFI